MACCENIYCNPHRYDPPTCVGPDRIFDRMNPVAVPGVGAREGMVDLTNNRRVVRIDTGDPIRPTTLAWEDIDA